MTVRWTPEMDEALRNGIARRVALESLSEDVGVTRKVASKRAKELGLNLRRPKAWTDEEVAHLRRLWGRKSASQIAVSIGRSRNAVLGKVDRLGLGSAL